jgi:hypothetical protein
MVTTRLGADRTVVLPSAESMVTGKAPALVVVFAAPEDDARFEPFEQPVRARVRAIRAAGRTRPNNVLIR